MLLCQGIFPYLQVIKASHARIQTSYPQHFANNHPSAADSKSRWDPWLENAAFVCVTEFRVGWCFTVNEVIALCAALCAASAACLLMLLGHGCRVRPLDFSHGSQTLGQTAGVLSPVTSFQRGPTRAKRAWETQSAQGPAVKLCTEHVQMLD